MRAVVEKVETGEMIRLPDFDPELSRPSPHVALASVGIEPNDFGATVGPYRYQFEGEEDLLHLIVTRMDSGPLSAEEGQAVAGFVLRGVPPALIWLKPGVVSQHFYCGHDYLLESLELP